jgi:hypothetical protein
MYCVLKFDMRFNNLYGEVGNPLFESDGVVFQRAFMPPDLTGYLPDDLVAPYESAHRLPNEEPLTARDVRSALWLCAGSVSKAAKRLGVPSARVRAFVRNSQWIQQELDEARERILDVAEANLYEALFSDDPKRRDSAARYILTKSQTGRARLHALTDHPKLETGGGAVDIRWVE